MGTHRTFIATYIMANGRNGALYVGMTANLTARVWKHKQGAFEGHSKIKGCTRLVWFERHALVVAAIVREKRIKGWKRDWKLKLIEDANPPGGIWRPTGIRSTSRTGPRRRRLTDRHTSGERSHPRQIS